MSDDWLMFGAQNNAHKKDDKKKAKNPYKQELSDKQKQEIK